MTRYLGICVLLAGCSSLSVVGRTDHGGIPPDPLAVYRIPQCTSMSDGSLTRGERYVYYLVHTPKGLSLIELDINRFGVAIENTSTDEKGRHFAYYLESSSGYFSGYDFIIPEDLRKPGLRLKYFLSDFQVIKTDTSFRLQGTPDEECEIRPVTPPVAPAGQTR